MTKRLTQLSRSINGSVAIVTGAASGIGRDTAYLLADEGARVALVDINKDAVEQVAKVINDNDGEALPIAVDLSSRSRVQQVIQQAVEYFGAIDILINNAGRDVESIIDSDGFEQVWDDSLAIMVTAQAWAIRAALPALRNSEHPRIVNVASAAAFGATLQHSAYSVAKHACVGLTRSMAVDLGSEGITVNCVCPGPINTAQTESVPEEMKMAFAGQRTSLLRFGESEEVAHAILNLVIPAASYITGSTFVVDGGFTIRNA